MDNAMNSIAYCPLLVVLYSGVKLEETKGYRESIKTCWQMGRTVQGDKLQSTASAMSKEERAAP
jgi:hypothetical protein